MRRTAQALLFVTLSLAAVAFSAIEVPYLSGRVNDEAEILSPQTRRSQRLTAGSWLEI